jgi:hypothetical protein
MSDPVKHPNPGDPIAVKPVKFIHRQNGPVPTYQADGAWGGANQYGLIRMSFYTEAPPIPNAVIQPVYADGRPKGDPQFIGGEDTEHFLVVRDFQCDVILTLAGAHAVHQMLGNFIQAVGQQMRDQVQAIQQQQEEAKIKPAPSK